MLNFQKMMKQAQEMQYKMQEVQEKLKDITVQSESGGGLVKVTMDCGGDVSKIEIDQSLMDTDKETLEDLLVAAMNNANDAKEDKIKEETKSMMDSLGLPPGSETGLPF